MSFLEVIATLPRSLDYSIAIKPPPIWRGFYGGPDGSRTRIQRKDA